MRRARSIRRLRYNADSRFPENAHVYLLGLAVRRDGRFVRFEGGCPQEADRRSAEKNLIVLQSGRAVSRSECGHDLPLTGSACGFPRQRSFALVHCRRLTPLQKHVCKRLFGSTWGMVPFGALLHQCECRSE